MTHHRTASQNPAAASPHSLTGSDPAATASGLLMPTSVAHAYGNPTNSAATPSPGLLRRSLLRLTVLFLGVAGIMGLVGVSAASASVNIAGDVFSTSVDCGGSPMLINSRTTLDSTAYTMVYIQDRSTGVWIHETSWHPVNSWSGFRAADFTFNRTGYFNVYLRYLQWTSAGWQQNGEYLSIYNQHVGLSYYRSTTCRML